VQFVNSCLPQAGVIFVFYTFYAIKKNLDATPMAGWQ